MALAPTIPQQNQAINGNPWAQMLAIQPVQPNEPPTMPYGAPGAGRAPAGTVNPAAMSGLDPAVASDPTLASYFPSFVPYQPPPDEVEARKKMQLALEDQMGQQKGGIENLKDLLAKRQSKYTNINWSPLASFIDSNVAGSKLNEGAQAINTENEKTTALAEKIQDAQNQMSKEYATGLGEQLKAAQFGGQLQHQQQIANAQQGRVLNAQMLTAQRAFDNNPLNQLYRQRLDGAANILRVMHNIETEKDPDKRIALTAPLLQQIDNEKAALEAGKQGAAAHIIDASSQALWDADVNKLYTYYTSNIKNVDAPQVMKQGRILITHMMDNYKDAMQRQFNTQNAGVSPIQKQVFDAKIQAFKNNYDIGKLETSTPKDTVRQFQGADGTVHTLKKIKDGVDENRENWQEVNQ